MRAICAMTHALLFWQFGAATPSMGGQVSRVNCDSPILSPNTAFNPGYRRAACESPHTTASWRPRDMSVQNGAKPSNGCVADSQQSGYRASVLYSYWKLAMACTSGGKREINPLRAYVPTPTRPTRMEIATSAGTLNERGAPKRIGFSTKR